MVWANADTLPQTRAKAAAGRVGFSDRGLRKLLQAAEALREYLNQGQSNLVVQVVHLLPQSLHSAFGTAAVEVGVPVDAVQSDPGHASTSTTVIDNKAGACRAQSKMAKMISSHP
ncbi:hypothetical protein [Ralstonia solanacearum]|uniref:hypothetical protein n=1 Tax=Ralstonia solanacearum TaxID=305 RepID=UPI000501809F|nr:hypothetical protein [Ralstonia solanacearum]KFX77705.1 hypothetical protein KR98_17765 [Ralstonia solanacearum]OCQ64988.1 hypothetical protein AR465_10305 [Ralstonia solanacearum]